MVSRKDVIPAIVISGVRAYQEALTFALEQNSSIRIVAYGSNLDQVLDGLKERPVAKTPTVALVALPSPHGPEVAKRLSRIQALSVLGLGVDALPGDVFAWARAGAVGCLGREQSLDAVISAVQRVANGETVCSPELAASVFHAYQPESPSEPQLLGVLTRRELEILQLAADDLTNKEIAQRLHIEVSTVKNHLQRLFRKLDIHRRTEARDLMRRMSGRAS